jgi:hypothetical protein
VQSLDLAVTSGLSASGTTSASFPGLKMQVRLTARGGAAIIIGVGFDNMVVRHSALNYVHGVCGIGSQQLGNGQSRLGYTAQFLCS